MSHIHSSLLLGSGAAAGGFQVSRSLRFNSADSAYLSRSPSVSSNRKTWTWSGWVKRQVSAYQQIFTVEGATIGNYFQFAIENDDKIAVRGASNTTYLRTTQVLRDPSAWYQVLLAVDTTQSTPSNTLKLFLNGSQITTFDTSTYPSQNTDLNINTTNLHWIGRVQYSGFGASHSDCYLADVHFIDGQALTPSSFTEVSATTGQLIPKAYSGSYGTNGFYLQFADNSAATATTLGKDTSGNGNNWTPNNLSVTAGAGNDSLVDTPTSYGTDTGVGGEVRGNYATLNPLSPVSGFTLSNGNLDVSFTSYDRVIVGTFGMTSGKWYWEYTQGSSGTNQTYGILSASAALTAFGGDTGGYCVIPVLSRFYANGSFSTYGSSLASGDVLGVAFNADTGILTFYKNGTTLGTASSSIPAGTYLPSVGNSGTGTNTAAANFGQRPFAYTAPSGFKALCDTNLPAPVVAKPNTAMDVKLYTGNGGTQSITGLGFNPDLVWLKARSAAYGNVLHDAVRGAGYELVSNLTVAESFGAQYLQSFNSDGFTVGNNNAYNQSSVTYAAWAWDAGSSTVTNTQGSITTSLRASPSSGFSVCTFTTQSSGTGTFGHGLNVAPSLVITKARAVANNWIVYHASVGNTGALLLNSTAATDTQSFYWNNTTPTSAVVTLGTGFAGSNSLVAYCFAPVSGYSSMSSYVGNGSSDGVFVYCGFRPKFIIIKRSSGIGDWVIYDSVRLTYNASNVELYANSSGAEAVDDPIDVLSNGFKIRATGSGVNASGNTYVFAAFAESPFQYARAR